MMQGKTLVLILATVVLSVLGQLFLKTGAQQLTALGRGGFLLAAFRNLHILTGLAAWAGSAVCWLYVLRVAPLSRAYGLTSLTYVLVFVAGIVLFGEHVRPLHVLGTVLIVVGIAFLLYGD
jgi:multidrug transporter EmrE-like cation transporter